MVKNNQKLKVLFISANFDEKNIVKSNQEFMKIKNQKEKSFYNDFIKIEPALALNRIQLREVIGKIKPEIIHFSGHGEKFKGPLFQDDLIDDPSDLMSNTISVLEEFKDTTRFIFFNICDSFLIAEKVAKFTNIVIATNSKVDDYASINLANGFYEKFFRNIPIKPSFDYALGLYKKSQVEGEYILFDREDSKSNEFVSLLEKPIWEIFKGDFDASIEHYLNWILKFAITISMDNLKPFYSLFLDFLVKFLEIKIDNKITQQLLREAHDNPPRNIITIFLNHCSILNNHDYIRKEDVFSKLERTLQYLMLKLQKNIHIVNIILMSFYETSIKSDDELRILIEPFFESFKISWLSNFKLLDENIKKPLIEFQVNNREEIVSFSESELHDYCRKHLELADLASKYGNRFDENLFVNTPHLESEFKKFIHNLENRHSKERIFLLLGHMGLGKTWNVSYLAFKYVDVYPTFYYHLGISYESNFEFTLGDFNQESKRIRKLSNLNPNDKKQVLIIFDGFDELSYEERNSFLPKLIKLVKNNHNDLMVILTSRLVDWVNSEIVLKKAREHKQYIYQNEGFQYFETINIRTGSSYVLSDIEQRSRLIQLNKNYGIELDLIKDERLKKLLQKPFIVDLISKKNLALIQMRFNPKSEEWFKLFADQTTENTILGRMGIIEEKADIFKELVCEIADPYTPILEDELKYFIKENEKNWDVIYSSGIIRKQPKDLQYEFYFKKEFQEFIDHYISKLKSEFHGTPMCKADKYWMQKLELELSEIKPNFRFQNIESLDPKIGISGFKRDSDGRISTISLYKCQLPYIPKSISKLIHLKVLNLQNNKLTRLPEYLGNLKYLETINLNNNALVEIPNFLTKLKNLKRIRLENNNIGSFKSWWKEFENLKYVNLYRNEKQVLVDKEPRCNIEFISPNIKLIDDQLPLKINDQRVKDVGKLLLKDAAVVEYLYEMKRLHTEINYKFEFHENVIKKLTIDKPRDLSEIFWSLEYLEELHLIFRSTYFLPNNSIRKMYLINSQPESGLSLKIDPSIKNLKNLKILRIENFSNLTLPSDLQFLSHIKTFIIDCPAMKPPPLYLIEENYYPNIILNALSKRFNDFPDIIEKNYPNFPHLLISMPRDESIDKFFIGNHIKNFCLLYNYGPSTIEIRSELKKLLIASNGYFKIEDFLTNNLWNMQESGNFIFIPEKSYSYLPKITADFSKLTHLRIECTQVLKLEKSILESPNIEKLIISNFNLPIPINESFKEISSKLFQIRVANNCKLPDGEFNLRLLTNFHIRLPQLTELPNFISSLNQFNRLIISYHDDEIKHLTFGSKSDKFRFVFLVSKNCEFPRFLQNLKNLSHVWINLPSMTKLPNDFELYFKDTKKIKLYKEKGIEENIDDYLKLENPEYYIIRVHQSCILPLVDSNIFHH